MRRAILADIHSNQTALEAVLADIRRLGVDEVVCLGDVVGYGARPKECVDHVRKLAWTVKGNHDLAVLDLEQQKRFSARALDAIVWTRGRLEDPADPESKARLAFLQGLPEHRVEGDVFYCHGSPRVPVNEYLKPDMGERHPDRLKVVFGMFQHVLFVAHTHVPGVFTEDLKFQSPVDLGNEYTIDPGKVIINVGSVGQPRDRNPRACYVVFDGETVVYRRVQYDIDVAASRIYAVPELEDGLGDRLYEGR